MNDETNGWPEYRKLVLSEIQRLDAETNAVLREVRDEVSALRDSQTRIREDIAGLKAQSGIIGGLAGAVSSLLGSIITK